MSAVIAVAVYCDRCRKRSPVVEPTAWQVRYLSQAKGWHRNNGDDLCPDCWAAGARGPTARRRAA